MNYMGIDQYGNTYHGLVCPRRDLMWRIGCQHVEKMYVDTTDGRILHSGYVIGGLWISVYRILPMHKMKGI